MRTTRTVERSFRPDEVAEIFSVSKNTIYRWVREGKFPAGVMNGRTRLWFESDLVEKQAAMRESA